MTEFYKTGTYWPDSSNCEIADTFDESSMQGLEVITIAKSDDADDYTCLSPTLIVDDFGFDMVVEEGEDDDGDEDDEEMHDHIDIIFNEDHLILEEGDETSNGSSNASDAANPSQIIVKQDEEEEPPRSQIFADELELLLTNVDGDDCDPDTVVIPNRGRTRRLYRKSMSLPMSPVNVGGARERLDSINFSEFLLSPLKLGGLEHHDVDAFEHISPMNDFNLISFMGADAVFSPPTREPTPQVNKVSQENARPATTKRQMPEEPAPPPQPTTSHKKAPPSRGKCIDLLKATHQRQENMAKRCGAMETKRLSVKDTLPAPAPPKKKPVMPRKLNLDDDPQWSPLQNVIDGSSKRSQSNCNLKVNHKPTQSKTVNSNKRTQDAGGAGHSGGIVSSSSSSSSNSNLNELKRKFLANIPTINAQVKPKKAPARVILADVPILPPSDHNYCSPAKHVHKPQAKLNQQKAPKSTILMTDPVPLKSKVKSPMKAAKSVAVPVVAAPVLVKEEEKVVPPVVVPPPQSPKPKKKRAINLEDYKKLRSGQSVQGNKETPQADQVKKNMAGEAASDHSSTPVSLLLPKDYVDSQEKAAGKGDAKYLDPISEAKNKALRMAERRKAAARQKEEEIQIKAPLVPILPLAVMTGLMSEESYLAELKASKEHDGHGLTASTAKQTTAPFEEIMIVSVGCNTTTTIRPDYDSKTILSDLPSNAPLTSSSLLFSIQDAVIKKTGGALMEDLPATGEISPGKPEGAKVGAEANHQHGEDKVIMHLRKDRLRPKTFSVGCQTETTPEFPQLICLKVKAASANKRNYRRRSVSCSSRSSSSDDDDDGDRSYYSGRSRSPSAPRSDRGEGDYSDAEEHEVQDEFGRSAKRRRLYSNRSRSRSCRRSRSREGEVTRYNSRSRSPWRVSAWNSRNSGVSSRSRSRSPCYSVSSSSRPMSRNNGANGGRSNNRWPKKNNPSPEERRIVYVGRLEPELTKEDLRAKFVGYGAVKLVTLHEKTNGTRYGFVTFEEPSEAFKAIESAKDDSRLKMYDIGFGGRRAFCGASYADLDNVEAEEDMYGAPPSRSAPQPEESFESLLLSFKRKVAGVEP